MPTTPDAVVYFIASAMMIVITVLLIWKDGGYRTRLYSMVPLSNQLAVVIKSVLLAAGISMAMLFLVRPILVSRVFLFFTIVFVMGLTMISRVALVMFDRWMGRRGAILSRFIIVGTSEFLPSLIGRLRKMNTSLGFVGLVGLHHEEGETLSVATGLPLLGTIKDIGRIFHGRPFDGVLFVANGHDFGCNPELKESIIAAVNFCEVQGIPFYMIPHSLDVAVSRHEMGSVYGCPVIEIRDASQHLLYQWVKRFMDVTVSTAILILGVPLWLAIIAMIKLTGRGPVIYSQQRVGLNGRLFRITSFAPWSKMRSSVCVNS